MFSSQAFFSPAARPIAKSIQLLVVQPTPFCNIQCDYCYLPDRDSTARLDPATFRELLTKVFASGLAGDQLSIVWHAGEPMALPLSYYRSLFDVIDQLKIPRGRIRHSFQTNGTLISDSWCEFIRGHNINIGVSIDGPAFVHDLHRKDRQGHGTHARVMKGIADLREHEIDFHAIAVITSDSLDHADAIFSFFLDLGIQRLGFNVEELEGEHGMSSLLGRPVESRIRRFWTRLYELQNEAGDRVRIREFERAYEVITKGPPSMAADQAARANPQVAPFGIVNMDWQGNLSSFSPELLGAKSVHYGDFRFGNIGRGALLDVCSTDKFRRISGDIYAGVERCQRSCGYFGLCGGGAPSNKYFENGTFVSTETMYCRTSVQMPVDVVLGDLERHQHLEMSTRSA